MVELWYAEDGEIKINNAAGTATDYTAEVREISISGGDREVEQILAFGNNQYLRLSPEGAFETSVTVLKQDVEFAQMLLGGTDTNDPILAVGGGTRPASKKVQYTWTESANATGSQLRITFANVMAVSKELSLDTEGHLEESVTFRCKAADYREEYTADRSANALPTGI